MSDERPPRRSRRAVLAVVASVAAGLVGLGALAAAFVRLPYVLISPGQATPVEDAVQLDGVPTFEPDGSFLFLTVTVSTRRPNVYSVLEGWLDDDIAVESEDEVFGGLTRRQERRLNVRLMTDSQLAAMKVSFERLGYEVPVSGAGAVVTAVERGSPASGRLRTGDVITAIDGMPVELADQLGPAVRARPPGASVTLTVRRRGSTRAVTLDTRPAPEGPFEGRAQLGVSAATRDLEFDFPFDVEIDPGDVSGPSAGLAFALTILDELSPGDLTGGRRVAVTGTIELDGSVGRVSGVAQKAVTAREAGAALMLVPEAELAEARDHAGGMRVVGVRDLDGALDALRERGGDPLPPPDALPPT